MDNSCELRVGRLIELRVMAGFRVAADVTQFFARIAREFAKLPSGTRAVTVADWRFCPIMSEEIAEQMVQKMSGNNSLVVRSAALASNDSPVAVLQFIRLVRESKHPDRRLFDDPQALVQWLSKVLAPPEIVRLNAFLREGERLARPRSAW